MTKIFRYRVWALTAALALGTAACAGVAGDTTSPTLPSLTESSADSNGPNVATTTMDPEEAMREYTSCMREHGVELPDPSSGGSVQLEVSSADFAAVFEEAEGECSKILDAAFGDFELSPEQEAENRDRELAFAQCMRDAGIDWPDPGAGTGMIQISADSDFDIEAMNEVLDTCSEEVFGDVAGHLGSSSTGATP